MLRLKSLEGSDGTALALLSNDINSSVALCRDLLDSPCCTAASILNAADDAVAVIASHHDRVMLSSAPAAPAAAAAAQSLQQLQRCVADSEQLRSLVGAVTHTAVADGVNSCRCFVLPTGFMFALHPTRSSALVCCQAVRCFACRRGRNREETAFCDG
jgi:hypothetical protein